MRKPEFLNLFALALAALLAAIGGAHAGGEINAGFFGNVAIEGYDPVAYFTEARPVEGRDGHEFEWKGAVWRFASAANRERFAKSPEMYAPQYGGYCAWAVSQGYTAKIDPAAWRIVDGKLYLNYSKSVQRQWTEEIAVNIAEGDRNWPGIEGSL